MTECPIDYDELDEKATAWVNSIVPSMYKQLERAGIIYSEDLLCECLSDGFKAGYVARVTEPPSDMVDTREK